jgi:VWFA-related protein
MASDRSGVRPWLKVTAVLLTVSAATVVHLGARGAGQRQQPPTPTFRAQVNVVQVDAVVLDRQGSFVSDLRPEEFEILEDGKPQRIASTLLVHIPVERVDAPLFAAGTRVVKPDVQTNARSFEGRIFVIILDDLQTAPNRSLVARRIAREFIEKNIGPGDIAAVVPTSGNRLASQELTNDRRLLLQATDQFIGRKIPSPGISLLSMAGTPDSVQPVGTTALAPADPAAPARIANAIATMQTLADLSRFAGRIRDRRKAIVYISEGIDYPFGGMQQSKTAGGAGTVSDGGTVSQLGFVHTEGISFEVRDRLRDFVEAANRGNVTLYAFDPRVYTQGGDDFVDIASGLPENMNEGNEQDKVKSLKLADDLVTSQDNLRTMATETGGFAVTASRKEMATGFDRVRTETSNYYMIGYYPSNEARDGKFRKIEVRVKRPGLRVSARKGYTAPKGSSPAAVAVDARAGTSPEVFEALSSALPVSGFTLSVSAAAFKGLDANASVVVIVQAPGSALTFVPKGDRFEDTVELSVVAIDRIGKTRGGERAMIEMPLTQKMQSFVAQTGLTFQVRMSLPSGQYQLRIAGRDAGSERVGSVHYDLEVPDFLAGPLSMSGLVLTAEQAGQVPSPRPDETLKKLLPGSPITTREFAASDELTVLAEVYDNKAGQLHTVRLATTLLGDDGRALATQSDARSTSDLTGGRGAFGFTQRIPLGGLGPGLYVLRVEARSTLDTDAVVTREVQFRVK